MAQGFLTPGFSIVGQNNLNNNGEIVGVTNTPFVNDLLRSFTSPGSFPGPSLYNTQGGKGTLAVVGGGGGGGRQGGGGGAGGVVVVSNFTLPTGTPFTIGGGGSGGVRGSTGSPTTWNGPITYTGNGGGGSGQSVPQYTGPSGSYDGQSGGSGGGGGRGNNNPGWNTSGGPGTQPGNSSPGGTNYGFVGGIGTSPRTQDNRSGGGGGGAGGQGGPGTSYSSGGLGISIAPYAAAAGNPTSATDGGYIGGGGNQPGVPQVPTQPGQNNGGGANADYFTGPPGLTGTGGGGGRCYNGGAVGSNGGTGGIHVYEVKAGPRRVSGRWTTKDVYTAVIGNNWV
jgi:hypothetical protein